MKLIGLMLMTGLMPGLLSACLSNQINPETSSADLGVVPIGGLPKNLAIFTATDCDDYEPKFYDCSARDAEGREYAFFSGSLVKVSVDSQSASKELRLPAGLEFGESIELSAKKIIAALGVELIKGKTIDGNIVYASDFVIPSSIGTNYSIELLADKNGRLVELTGRTDAP